MALAPAIAFPRRFLLPPESRGDGSIPLEMHIHALYSSFAIDAAVLPREMEHFAYTRGNTVAGAGAAAIAATDFHTNLIAVRTLPKPKTFTVLGLRMIIPGLTYTATAALQDTTGAALAATQDYNDVVLYMESTSIEFVIGEKVYIEIPTRRVVGNTGFGGISVTSISSTNAASIFQNRLALHTQGPGYDLTLDGDANPPVLWNQQNFTFKVRCQWATTPTMLTTRLAYAWFDGIEGREVQ